MEQQNHDRTNKRINLLIAVAGVAMVVGLAGLAIVWAKTMVPSSSPIGGSAQPGSSSQVIDGPTFTPGEGDTLKRGSASNN